jgi:hypothetical protein
MDQAGDDREELTSSVEHAPSLIAYRLPGRPDMEIVPAGRWCEWMEHAHQRWPARCLPMLVANESGWWLLNPRPFSATWDGGPNTSALHVEYDDPPADPLASSHFGSGIVTWQIPYLFRTDPGWNLLARGPANQPKHGAGPLEGLVETDWSTATFTMNWKLTQPGTVRFEAGEPICMIVPQRRHDLESFEPTRAQLVDDAELHEAYTTWRRDRDQLNIQKFVREAAGIQDPGEWQKHYFKGKSVSGRQASEHQTKRRLAAFDPAS